MYLEFSSSTIAEAYQQYGDMKVLMNKIVNSVHYCGDEPYCWIERNVLDNNFYYYNIGLTLYSRWIIYLHKSDNINIGAE